jgi:hypothetical protein
MDRFEKTASAVPGGLTDSVQAKKRKPMTSFIAWLRFYRISVCNRNQGHRLVSVNAIRIQYDALAGNPETRPRSPRSAAGGAAVGTCRLEGCRALLQRWAGCPSIREMARYSRSGQAKGVGPRRLPNGDEGE